LTGHSTYGDIDAVRSVYPALAVLAYLFFVISLVLGFLLVAAVPVLASMLAAALVMGGQLATFVRLLGSLLRLTFGSIGVAARLLRDLALAVFERDEAPVRVPWSYGRQALPEVFRLVDEVGDAVGTRGVDRVLLSPRPQFGVFDLAAPGALGFLRRPRRHLVVGLPYAYALSLDELRAVVAHELAHFTLGHTTLSRMTWHFIGRIAGRLASMQEGEFWALNPVYWCTRVSLGVLAAIYGPWSRLQEFDADRRSAQAAGSNHAISALRKCREAVPAVSVATELVAEVARLQQVAPRHLGEAAARLSWRMEPAVKRRLARAAEGDPLDLEGRTHPPTAHRIAALHGLAEKPALHGELAAKYLPDLRNLEEHVTRATLRVEQVEAAQAYVERVMAHLGAPTAA
jgi:Zn-dependent protease with chaperone function